MISEDLQLKMKQTIKLCNEVYSELENNNLLNEQFALNWLDDLNAISVQY